MRQRQDIRASSLFRLRKISLPLAALLATSISNVAWSQSSGGADTTKIVIGQSSSGPAQIPLYIALDQDFFRKAGLDVSSQTLSGGSTSAAAAFVKKP